jgi:WD40 repeat protein
MYRLLFVTKSYYGGTLSVSFSPDSKYICVGGEDDMIHIYSLNPTELKLLVRGQGHNSWINKVIFDSHHTSTLSYSIYSVGQDGNLCIWYVILPIILFI